jgi:hypothetical protein
MLLIKTVLYVISTECSQCIAEKEKNFGRREQTFCPQQGSIPIREIYFLIPSIRNTACEDLYAIVVRPY